MKIIKTAILFASLGVAVAAQANTVPSEMFQPANAQIIQSQVQKNNGYELELRVTNGNVSDLAKQAIKHLESKGYRVVKRQIYRNDAKLTFRKANQELSISMDKDNQGWIEIDQDLETKRGFFNKILNK